MREEREGDRTTTTQGDNACLRRGHEQIKWEKGVLGSDGSKEVLLFGGLGENEGAQTHEEAATTKQGGRRGGAFFCVVAHANGTSARQAHNAAGPKAGGRPRLPLAAAAAPTKRVVVVVGCVEETRGRMLKEGGGFERPGSILKSQNRKRGGVCVGAKTRKKCAGALACA